MKTSRRIPFRQLMMLSLCLFAFPSQANDPNRMTLRMMEELRIPEIRFEQAEVQDALHFLVQASRLSCPDGIGLNLAYFAPESNQPAPRKITLELRNISLGDALRLVVNQSGMVYRLERGVVRVEPHTSQRLETRFYPVDPGQFQQFQERSPRR